MLLRANMKSECDLEESKNILDSENDEINNLRRIDS